MGRLSLPEAYRREILKRINRLIRDTQRSPFEDPGKPVALKHGLPVTGFAGYDEHRLVYRIRDPLFSLLSFVITEGNTSVSGEGCRLY